MASHDLAVLLCPSRKAISGKLDTNPIIQVKS